MRTMRTLRRRRAALTVRALGAITVVGAITATNLHQPLESRPSTQRVDDRPSGWMVES